ncbi:tetratricopeptide repeat protein [Streptomyces erythrochromogenes]|uniref:tetratricopeptide repeat protein n=1 Tax=Streptomyces erythrochromogenes TaxID=285574 RepID=UPI0036FDF9D6
MTDSVFQAIGAGSVAAHHIGTAVTGPVNVLTAELLNSARDVQAPAGLTNLPPLPLCFGRTSELDRLRGALEQPTAGTAVVQGLGGVGKSTLALAYAHSHRRDYTVMWWIAGASPDHIEQSLAGLALRLIPVWAGSASTEDRAAWAMLWLQWHPGWLLIFDNVENPADLQPYVSTSNGHVIATSRRSAGWPTSVTTLALDVLDLAAASDLLCSQVLGATSPTHRQIQETRALSADLGQLPLALMQAGAYLAQNPTISIERYRRRLIGALDKAPEGVDPERTVARIWRQTISTLTERNPLAVRVLSTLAWLAPDDIPVGLLTPITDDSDDLHEALGVLAVYCMVSLTQNSVSIHRLVQTTLRNQPPIGDSAPTGRLEAEWLLSAAVAPLGEPPDSGRSPAWDRLLPHLVALAASTPGGHTDTFLAGRYVSAADYLRGLGHEARAVPLLKAALARLEAIVSAEHELTMKVRANLANAYYGAGDFGRSIAILEPMVAQCAQVFGDSHPGTLTVVSNLANSYRESGDLARAVTLHAETLARRRNALGDDHPETLVSCEELARTYHASGDLDRSVSLHEATHTQYRRILGPTHPATLSSQHGLASAYLASGDLSRAIPMYTAVFAQRQQALGDSDPETITSRNNLAYAYLIAGRPEQAAQHLKTALARCEEVYGEAHPETIAVRANLGCAYRDAGDSTRSLPLLETAAAQSAHLLGDAHPHTLTTRNGLARAYQAAGQDGRAIAQYDTILKHRAALLGETHPHTLATRSGLANAHLAAGDPDRAVPLFETVVAQCEQVFGESHPDTLSNYIGLADALRQTDSPARAVPLSESTLERCVGSLGEDHPHTMVCRSNLALAHLTVGDAPRAVQLLEAAVCNAGLIFGDTHPHTITSRMNLAAAHMESDNAAQAVAVLEDVRALLEAELGRVHPQTLHCTAMLARALGGSGSLLRAIELLEHSVALAEKELDVNHPDTVKQRQYLAEIYRANDQPDLAVPLYEANLTHWQQTLGDHPNVLNTQLTLGDAHHEAGAHHEAIAVYRVALGRVEPTLGPENPLVAQIRARIDAAEHATSRSDRQHSS